MSHNVLRSKGGKDTGYLMPPGAERGTDWCEICTICGYPHPEGVSTARPSGPVLRRDTLTWPDGSHWTGPWQKVADA